MAEEAVAMINYYFRLGYGHHVQTVCSQHLQKRPHDYSLQFWHACGLMLEGSYPEAVREFELLEENRELQVAIVAALIHCEEATIGEDNQSSSTYKRLEEVEKIASERALLHAATLYCLLGGACKLQKAMEWVLRVLKVQPQYSQALCVKAWIKLGSSSVDVDSERNQDVECAKVENAAETFDAVLTRGNNLEAFVGKARFHELKGQYLEAINEMNKVIVVYPWFWPALVEKGRLALLLQDWDLVREMAHLLLQKDPSSISGLRLAAHVKLCTENAFVAAADLVARLGHSIAEKEPKIWNILLQVARPLARLAGRAGSSVVRNTFLMIEKACKVEARSYFCVLEMAEEQFLLGEYRAALASYRLATQLKPLKLEASYGAIQCLLILGDVEEAEQQLELMTELSVSVGRSFSLTYLLAQLLWLKQTDLELCQGLIEETILLHKQGLSKKMDYQYYVELDPDRLLGIAHLQFEFSRLKCSIAHTDISQPLLQAASVLELLLSAIPSSIGGLLLLSRVKFQLGEVDQAVQYLQEALRLDPTCACAHVLMAQVFISEHKYDVAKLSLDQALSNDFVVRDTVQFLIAQAQIHVHAEEYEMAQRTLESALCLPEMDRTLESPQLTYYSLSGLKSYLETSDSERVQVYVLLANLYMRLGRSIEATQTLQKAKKIYTGTCEEGQVLLASCGLALAMRDIDCALQMLRQVSSESKYFLQAKVEMAEIFLNHLKDKELFASCYVDLANMFHDAKTLIMLGEAYTKIDEPERAVEAFQAAMNVCPHDASVASKVGHCLMTTHHYNRAISHYEAALQKTSNTIAKYNTQYDFAALHCKLHNYDEAERVLLQLAERLEDEHEEPISLKGVNFLLLCLKTSLLLSKVLHVQGKHTNATKVILNAKPLQNLLLNRLQGQHDDTTNEQKNVCADMYFQYAQECELQKDLDKAVAFLREALKCNPGHIAASLALAKIHLARCEIAECEQRCSALLTADPFNTEAGDMLVRLMLHRQKYESAVLHFEQMLDREPNHYNALAQLVLLYYRAGHPDKIAAFLKKAETGSPTSHTHAGLYYCKGLYARCLNRASEALQMLNTARNDREWGRPALYMMIELYLDVDQDFEWEESNQDGSPPSKNEEGVKAARKLLAESRQLDPKAVKQIVLESYAAMATGVKTEVENALVRLQELAVTEPEEASVLLALATALALVKQTAKSKSQLRSIEKLGYRWEDGDSFERAWLMLASMYLQARKHESAEEMCRTCLKYNKSCARAWECLGLIGERKHCYAEAAALYENAWKCHRETSPSVGYRLAYSYLKDKQLVRAISICHEVINLYPNYPRIKKDILEKARAAVRA